MDVATSFAARKAELQKKSDVWGLGAIPDRLTRIRAQMGKQGLDGLVVNYSTNVVYATGFDGIADEENPHIALVTADEALAILDSRYFEVASRQAETTQWQVALARHKVRETAVEAINERQLACIGIEDTMGYGQFLEWQEALEGSEVRATSRIVEEVREIKDLDEVVRIAQAQAITDEAFAHMLGFIKAGMTEREIAFELEFAMRRLGAEALAFPSIVAAGSNGSLPHAFPSDYVVKKGNLVTLDFGAQFGGYKADMTRTICVGKASELQKKVYAVVQQAQAAVLEAIKDGAVCVQVDSIGRQIIDAAGYGQYFGHGTGHGVGLDIHERPNCSPLSEDIFHVGAVVTDEPGIYLPGELGVRTEDTLLVTRQGSYVFGSSPKELVELTGD